MNTYYQALKFICRCLTPYFDRDHINKIHHELAQTRVPWELVIDLSNSYFVTPGLWRGLKSKGLDTIVDEEPRQYLHHLHALNQKRNTHLKRQLIEAIGILNAIGIQPLLLKGSGQLMEPIHNDIGIRIMSDLDILIPPELIPGAIDALVDQGYQEVDVRYDINNYHHWAPLIRPGEYGPIELHRRALHNDVLQVMPTQNIWDDARLQTIDDTKFYLPSPTHSILICMLHSHDLSSHSDPRQFNLRALQDLAAITKRYTWEIDWPLIHSKMKDHGFKCLEEAHLLAVTKLFCMPYPLGVMPGLSARLRHSVSIAAMNWSIAARLSRLAHQFSTYRIYKRYGCSQRLLPLSAYRMKYLFFYLKNRFNYNAG